MSSPDFPHRTTKLATVFMKIAAVVVLLVVFSQWYLPRRGYYLAEEVTADKNTILMMLREERWNMDCTLMNCPEEVTSGELLKNGMRRSYPDRRQATEHRILLVGDSCTFGMGLHDTQTFPWLLNDMFSECTFDNAAVPSYGPCSVLLSMQEYLPQRPYDMVIYVGIRAHLTRDAFYRTKEFVRDGLRRDCVFVRPYCTLQDSDSTWSHKALNMYPGGCVLWPGDQTLYLVNFLKHLGTRLASMYGTDTPWESDSTELLASDELKALRLRLMLDKMDRYAASQHTKFACIDLDYLFDSMTRYGMLEVSTVVRNQRSPYITFPVFKATYPVDFHDYPELCTKRTRFDDGNHPNAKVSAFYAETIGAWLSQPEVAGTWIGPRDDFNLDTGVVNGQYVGAHKS